MSRHVPPTYVTSSVVALSLADCGVLQLDMACRLGVLRHGLFWRAQSTRSAVSVPAISATPNAGFFRSSLGDNEEEIKQLVSDYSRCHPSPLSMKQLTDFGEICSFEWTMDVRVGTAHATTEVTDLKER